MIATWQSMAPMNGCHAISPDVQEVRRFGRGASPGVLQAEPPSGLRLIAKYMRREWMPHGGPWSRTRVLLLADWGKHDCHMACWDGLTACHAQPDRQPRSPARPPSQDLLVAAVGSVPNRWVAALRMDAMQPPMAAFRVLASGCAGRECLPHGGLPRCLSPLPWPRSGWRRTC